MHNNLLLTAVLLAGTVGAQQNIAWVNDGNAGTGSNNAFPWGSNGIRYQTIVDGTKLPAAFAVINDVFVAGRPGGSDMEIVYDDIEIRMGLTGLSTVTTSWTSNNPNPTVVYRGPLRTFFQVGAWRGIGLPTPYNFLPTPTEPNLCFEVIVWSTPTGMGNFYFPENDNSVQRAFRFQWTTNQTQAPLTGSGGGKMGLLLGDGNFVEVGTGCSGTSNQPLRFGASTYPQGGKPIDLLLTNAAPSSPVFLVLGTSFTTLGTVPLPLDLTFAGAPSCFLWNDAAVVLGAAADAMGNAKLTLGIPMQTGFGRIYGTWANLDGPANPLGLTTSSQGKLILGL